MPTLHLGRAALSLSLCLYAAAPLWAQPALPDALSAARARGCEGRPGTEAPLRQVAALSDAARRLAQGVPWGEAARQAGYRANRALQIHLRGPTAAPAVADAVRRRHCQALSDPRLSELGLHQRGASTWIVLAEPFSPPPRSQADEIAQRVLEQVNQARAQPRRCGERWFAAAPPLRLDAGLGRAAQMHAQDMARHGFMAHRGSDGSAVADRVSRAGYDWQSVGENVAAGPQEAEQVVQGWLRSPGHCANIMQPAFTDMGVAYAVNAQSQGGIYWAQVLAASR